MLAISIPPFNIDEEPNIGSNWQYANILDSRVRKYPSSKNELTRSRIFKVNRKVSRSECGDKHDAATSRHSCLQRLDIKRL